MCVCVSARRQRELEDETGSQGLRSNAALQRMLSSLHGDTQAHLLSLSEYKASVSEELAAFRHASRLEISTADAIVQVCVCV